MAQKTIKARVLAAFTFSGTRLQPNDVVTLADKDARACADSLDSNAEAVAAALESGGKAIDLTRQVQDEEQAAADQPQG